MLIPQALYAFASGALMVLLLRLAVMLGQDKRKWYSISCLCSGLLALACLLAGIGCWLWPTVVFLFM